MEERKYYLDILRALATVGVVVIHVSANNWYGYIGSGDWIVFSIYEGLCKVAVPFFFMISGCLFLNSNRTRKISDLFAYSIRKLIIFLLFWSVIYKLLRFPGKRNLFIYLKHSLVEILLGNTETHLWFVYAIIGIYMLVPLLQLLVQHADKKILLYGILICVFFGGICEFSEQVKGLAIVANNLRKIRCGISMGYIGYFLLGAYIDKYNIEEKFRKAIYVLGVIGVLMSVEGVLLDCILTRTLNERFWRYTTPGIYLGSVAVYLLFRNKSFDKNNIMIRNLNRISANSLGIYGIHFVFIIIFWKIGFDTFLFPGVLSVPFISLVVLLCSYISAIGLKKIPRLGKYIA